MKKPDTLRAALVAANAWLASNPDKLLVFVDDGAVMATLAPGLSYEYDYTLNVIVTDFSGDTDALMVPLLAWVRVHQSDLLDNPDKQRTGIRFEADILDNDRCDLSIKLQLTERAVVADDGSGTLTITYPPEPQPEAPLPPMHWTLVAHSLKGEPDQVLAEWDAPGA